MDMFTASSITALLYGMLFVSVYIVATSVDEWKRSNVFKYTMRFFGWVLLYGVFIVFGTASPDSTRGSLGADAAIILIAIPAVLALLAIVAFMIYHAIKHRNPFVQDSIESLIPDSPYSWSGEPNDGYHRGGGRRAKKMCTICGRETRCTHYDGKKGGIPFHTIRA